VAFGLLAPAAAAEGCGSTTSPADGGEAPPDALADGPSPDAAAADAGPDALAPPDAGQDAGRDASEDAGSDADLDSGPIDAGDGGPPTPLHPRTAVTGLSDFDFTADKLAVRIGQTFSVCDLPACSNLVAVRGTGAHNARFALAGNRLYFSARPPGSIQDNVFSIAFDGTDKRNRTNHVVPGAPQESFLGVASFSGGLTKVEQIVSWSRFGEAGYRTLVEITNGVSENPLRVGRATANTHENVGSIVRYFPEQMRLVTTENNPTRALTPPSMTVTGALLPTPLRDPTRIATSPRGPSVAHPMVVIQEDGALHACPTATDCLGWIDLGDLGGVFSLDATNLYVGGPRGLGRCALAEIATQGTCTVVPMAPREVVEDPMYLTADAVVWKSGTVIRAVAKTLGGPCPPGEGMNAAAMCVPCAAGEEPSPSTGRCEACPLGTYASAPGTPVCTPCPAFSSTTATGRTSAAACAACSPGETSNAHTGHVCVPTSVRRVFLTSELHDGDFASDTTLPGAHAIAKADAFCMGSAARPDSAVFKAMIVDGVHRDAVSRTDWVFLPSSSYVQADGATPLGTTNPSAILPLPLTNPWSSDPNGMSLYFWTGIGSPSWAVAPAGTCLGFSTNLDPERGNMGIAGRTSPTGIGAGTASPCSTPRHLLCVEQ